MAAALDARDHPRRRRGRRSFAASNSCLVVRGKAEAWFATGGKGAARVFHSTNGGRSWTVATTPVRRDSANAGIFSLAFADARHGIAVGGDYSKPADPAHNIAITSDGGKTWTEPGGTPPAGFRSAVLYLPDAKLWIATGTSGSDVSSDGGQSWRNFDHGNFNALAFASRSAGWAVGPRGRIAAIRWKASETRPSGKPPPAPVPRRGSPETPPASFWQNAVGRRRIIPRVTNTWGRLPPRATPVATWRPGRPAQAPMPLPEMQAGPLPEWKQARGAAPLRPLERRPAPTRSRRIPPAMALAPEVRTRRTIIARVAPSAMRTPSSLVRWLTVNVTTP